MTIEILPATRERFDDVATMLGPKNPTSSVCWCLSHRLDSRANRELTGAARAAYVHELTADVHPEGAGGAIVAGTNFARGVHPGWTANLGTPVPGLRVERRARGPMTG